jgi:hypothetical protein
VATYDYTTNSLDTAGGFSTATGAYLPHSALLPDGRLYVPGAGANPSALFNYATDSLQTLTSQGTSGCVLIPDGRIVTVPYDTSANVAVLDVANPRDPPLTLCFHPCFNKPF